MRRFEACVDRRRRARRPSAGKPESGAEPPCSPHGFISATKQRREKKMAPEEMIGNRGIKVFLFFLFFPVLLICPPCDRNDSHDTVCGGIYRNHSSTKSRLALEPCRPLLLSVLACPPFSCSALRIHLYRDRYPTEPP